MKIYGFIQLPDFLSVIQVTIQLLDHSAIGLLLAIQLPDVSDNRMPAVPFCYIHYTKIPFRNLWECETQKNLQDLKFAFLFINNISVTI